MFIVGVIGGALVGAVAHGISSDYDDDSDYSEYSDADMIRKIEAAKAESRQAERSLSAAENAMQTEYQDALETLRDKYGDIAPDAKNYEAFRKEKEQILARMKEKMESESKDAQNKVDEINAAIQKINQMQLKK